MKSLSSTRLLVSVFLNTSYMLTQLPNLFFFNLQILLEQEVFVWDYFKQWIVSHQNMQHFYGGTGDSSMCSNVLNGFWTTNKYVKRVQVISTLTAFDITSILMQGSLHCLFSLFVVLQNLSPLGSAGSHQLMGISPISAGPVFVPQTHCNTIGVCVNNSNGVQWTAW